MSMIDFDIANCKYNLTQCTFNVTVLTCKSEMYSHSERPKCHVKMAPLVLCIMLPLYSANPKLDNFCHVMKSIKKRYVCVVFEFLVCHWNH